MEKSVNQISKKTHRKQKKEEKWDIMRKIISNAKNNFIIIDILSSMKMEYKKVREEKFIDEKIGENFSKLMSKMRILIQESWTRVKSNQKTSRYLAVKMARFNDSDRCLTVKRQKQNKSKAREKSILESYQIFLIKPYKSYRNGINSSLFEWKEAPKNIFFTERLSFRAKGRLK